MDSSNWRERAEEEQRNSPAKQEQEDEEESRGGGWGGGWGFSSALSVLSDLQKAAQEISKNAVEVAKTAAKNITEVQPADASYTDTAAAEAGIPVAAAADDDDVPLVEKEEDSLRNSALDRLEKASQDSILGQGLKVIDNSVESFASGAWLALGSALKGGSSLVHRLEHSAADLAGSIHQGGLPVNASSIVPSILETGKSFTVKGIQVLERVSKETMDLLITETGLEMTKHHEDLGQQAYEEQFEEINFGRCFYIYGGPEQLEELEALSNHYTLIFNRKKTKLPSEQKSVYDGKLKQIQRVLNLNSEPDENEVDPDKGKHVKVEDDTNGSEMKILHDSSISKAADVASGFASAIGGLAMKDIIQRTTDRLDTAHAEGVHRTSELCSSAISHILMLGKSVISNASKLTNEERGDGIMNINWPEDSVSKAKIIRLKVQAMCTDVESVANSFVTGILEITEAYQAAVQSASSGAEEGLGQNSVQEKASIISNHLRAGQVTAVEKIQEAVQYLGYVILSASIPTV